jgi:hypothetical protein
MPGSGQGASAAVATAVTSRISRLRRADSPEPVSEGLAGVAVTVVIGFSLQMRDPVT